MHASPAPCLTVALAADAVAAIETDPDAEVIAEAVRAIAEFRWETDADRDAAVALILWLYAARAVAPSGALPAWPPYDKERPRSP